MQTFYIVPPEAQYPVTYTNTFIFFLRSLCTIIWMNVHSFPNAPRKCFERQNRSTEELKRSVDMTKLVINGINIRTNASPECDKTRCPEE